MNKATKKMCENGHSFYKSSDCPTCPVCEQKRKPKTGFLSHLASPARRALENQGITTLHKLSTYSKKEILALHGMGPASLPVLENALKENSLTFRKDD
jgi:DNA-directed RNA polymerase alpha subunit